MASEKRQKKKPSRKVRTARAPEASESESEVSSPPKGDDHGEQQPASTSEVENASHPATAMDLETAEGGDSHNSPAPQQPQLISPEHAFEEFYLRQATKEFSNDLDKLRLAKDFNERSVPVLIEALRQGGACFPVEERTRIGAAGVNGESGGGG